MCPPCPPCPSSDESPPSSSPAAPTRRLRSRAGKRLMARVHGVMIVLRAGRRCVGGFELSWCKDTPTRWMRPGHHSITGLPVCYRAGPSPVFCLCSRAVSRVAKCLTAGIHGVCLSSGQAGDALTGTNFPGVKILPTRWMRPGHSSITGLPASDRAGPSPVLSMQSCCLAGRKMLDSGGIHGVCLSSGQAGDALAGTNFPSVKTTPTRWMRLGHYSITGLPVCYRAGSPAVAYLFVSYRLAERRSTAVSCLCFPELPPRRRGFCWHRQTRR